MKGKYKIYGGSIVQYYHTIPSELEFGTVSPERESILRSLSQITHKQFPEFIKDVLEIVEGHTNVEITDGAGDEKQDILSFDKNGERQLTQCKHTVDYQENHSGNELDLLFAACFRKNCIKALYITNSDLTVQAKRYINDNEYSRGWTSKDQKPPVIDYWNGFKIWNKIKSNGQIINKWFSGLGQTHGLRNLTFKIVANKMPNPSLWNIDVSKEIFKRISKDPLFEIVSRKNVYSGIINNGIHITISKHFAIESDFNLRYISPHDMHGVVGESFWAFKILATVSDSSQTFVPEEITKTIVNYFALNFLPKLKNGEWWHLMTTGINSLIFVYEIQKPFEVLLYPGLSLIRHKKKCLNEETYTLLDDNSDFVRISDDNSCLWQHHPSGLEVGLFFEQKLHPVEVYNYSQLQIRKLEKLKELPLLVISGVEKKLLGRIRQLMHPDWLVLYSENSDLFWSYGFDSSKDQISRVEKAIEDFGLEIQQVREVDKERIFNNISTDDLSEFFMTSSSDSISTPVLLSHRIFWIMKKIEVTQKFVPETWRDLIIYKLKYESQHGFERYEKAGDYRIETSEFKSLLFEFLTIRGRRMIDISFKGNTISLNLRIKENSLMQSAELMSKYITEFKKISKDIEMILPQNIMSN